jgi:hypothetical protein
MENNHAVLSPATPGRIHGVRQDGDVSGCKLDLLERPFREERDLFAVGEKKGEKSSSVPSSGVAVA